jgi:hypothetical protein
MGGSTGLAHGVGHPSSLGAQHTPLSSGSKGLSGSCVILHPRPRCPPVRRSCGLGPRPMPCSRPARSWRFVRTMCSKWSASLRVRVALSTRGFHFNRFRGKRHRVRQVTGAHTPGRLSRCYRCDNVTMIGRLAPLTQGACAKAQGRAQASVTPWVALGEATAHTLPRKDVGEATRREHPRYVGFHWDHLSLSRLNHRLPRRRRTRNYAGHSRGP